MLNVIALGMNLGSSTRASIATGTSDKDKPVNAMPALIGVFACLVLSIALCAWLTLSTSQQSETTALSVDTKREARMLAALALVPESNDPHKFKVNSTNKLSFGDSALVLTLGLRGQFDDIIFALQADPAWSSSLVSDPSLVFQDVLTQTLLEGLALGLDLSSAGYSQLQSLFKRYIDFSLALGTLKDSGQHLLLPSNTKAEEINFEYIDLPSAQNLFENVYNLQQANFSREEISAFFGPDNTYDSHVLARLAIRQDDGLSPELKRQLIAEQISQLDEPERLILQPSLDAALIMETLTTTASNNPEYNSSNNQEYNSSAVHWDENVQQRLASTQKNNSVWRDKVANYLSFASTLAAKVSNADGGDENSIATEQARSLQDYLTQHFDGNEQKRLRVFLEHPELR
jgi:lipase chaperone LimK